MGPGPQKRLGELRPRRLRGRALSHIYPQDVGASLTLNFNRVFIRSLRKLNRKTSRLPVAASSLACQNHHGRAAKLDDEDRSWFRRSAGPVRLHVSDWWGNQLPEAVAGILVSGAYPAGASSSSDVHWTPQGRATDLWPNKRIHRFNQREPTARIRRSIGYEQGLHPNPSHDPRHQNNAE